MNQRVGQSNQQGALYPDTGLEALRRSPEFRGPVEPLDVHDHGDGKNDHFASIYEGREEQFATAIPFVRQGLDRGEQCLYVADDNSREEVLAAMRDRGIDADAAVESGALSILTKEETYLETGEFDRDAMLEFWEDALERARDEDGYAGIRAAAEMTWALDGETNFDRLVEYEAMLNDLYEDEEYVVLCQYDRERFPAAVVRDVIRTHPHLIRGDEVYHNVYYTPPEEYFGPDRPDREVDRMMGTLRERNEVKTELKERERYLREQNEITASPDRSFEAKLQSLFDLGCERFDLELGAMACVEPETDGFVIEYTSGDHEHFEPGTELPLSETYCTAVTETKGPASVSDPLDAGYEDITVHREFGLKTYLGTYVEVEGGPDRTFFFASSKPRDEEFSDEERSFHRLMGRWVQYELERQQREAELQESKERFERIFESSHDAIFILDPDADEFVDVNPAASEILGYERDELLSLGPSDIHPDELDRFAAFVDEVYEDGTGWTDQLTCRSRDGELIPAEISASTMEFDGRACILAMVRDISERKEREQAQRRLYEIAADADMTFEEKLQALFDLGCQRFDLELGGIARIDPETDLFEVEAISGEHEHLRPGAQVELSETYCRVFTDETDVAGITDPLDSGFEDTVAYEEFGVQTYLGTRLELDEDLDRTFFFVSSEPRSEPFSDAERTFHHLMGQWAEYELERRQRERELRERTEHLSALVETTPECIKTVAADGTLLQMNPAGLDMVEADADADVIGECVYDLIAPEHRERFREFNERICRGKRGTLEFDVVGLDGTRRHMESHAAPLHRPDGTTAQLALTRDVTERKERERELKRTERQFEAAFNNPSSFMGLLDPDGTVRRINETALEFGGIDESEVQGAKFWETPWFAHSEEVQEDLQASIERAADGEYVRGEIPHRSPDGDTVIMDAMLEPVYDENGEVVAIVPSGHDITERKEHEERLERKTDRLESFASMLAHELRNPVTIGQIYSQQLPAETDAGADGSTSEAFDYVTEAFDRIEEMIDVMLVLTRGQKAVRECKPVDLASAAREAWDEVDAPDATLDVELDDTIHADEQYARHLLRNLFENAVEHGSTSNRPSDDDAVEHGGKDVTVTVGDLQSGFYVADDGVGISPEKRDTVFEAGYTTASDEGGTGLGLAFVRELAEVYEWDCAVTESDAGGARFEFRNVDRDPSDV